MNINENRELYDLCRKYKFFYKQHEEIKKLDSCYWNKHIREAYKKSERDLNDVAFKIIELVLSEFIYDGGVSISQNTPIDVNSPIGCRLDRLGISGYIPLAEVTFSSNKLANIVERIMMEKGHGY